jgi:hypothetical protein
MTKKITKKEQAIWRSLITRYMGLVGTRLKPRYEEQSSIEWSLQTVKGELTVTLFTHPALQPEQTFSVFRQYKNPPSSEALPYPWNQISTLLSPSLPSGKCNFDFSDNTNKDAIYRAFMLFVLEMTEVMANQPTAKFKDLLPKRGRIHIWDAKTHWDTSKTVSEFNEEIREEVFPIVVQEDNGKPVFYVPYKHLDIFIPVA